MVCQNDSWGITRLNLHGRAAAPRMICEDTKLTLQFPLKVPAHSRHFASFFPYNTACHA